MTMQFMLTIGLLFVIVFAPRALPFIFKKKIPASVLKIGPKLPAYIMLCLVIYEINIESFIHIPYGIPEIMALLITAIIHHYVKDMVISLLIGTVVYFSLIALV